MLKVLDNVFYQRMTREAILPPADIKNIFTNLDEIVQLHGKRSEPSLMLVDASCYDDIKSGHLLPSVSSVSITEQMTAVRKKNETAVVDLIGDDLLSWVRELTFVFTYLKQEFI